MWQISYLPNIVLIQNFKLMLKGINFIDKILHISFHRKSELEGVENHHTCMKC